MGTKIEENAEAVKEVDQQQDGQQLSEADEMLEAQLGVMNQLREMAKRLKGEAMLLEAAAAAGEKRVQVFSQWRQELDAAQAASQK